MPRGRVYLGGLSYRAGDRDVEYFFRKYGKLKEISLKNGYAFIEFDDPRDADDAVYDLHGVDFMGERVTVEHAKGTPHGRDKERWGHPPRGSRERSYSRDRDRDRRGGRSRDERPIWLDKYGPPTRTEYRITVENLSSKVSWQDLKDFMRTAGEVTFADAHKSRKNEGMVEFASKEDMETALDKLDDTELNGRRIRLIPERGYKDSPDRRRGGQRRSRSDSRSRSRSPRRTKSRSRSNRRSRSRSASRSPSRSKSGSDRSRSRSKSPKDRRSRSKDADSPKKGGDSD